MCACEIRPKEYIVHCGGEPHVEGSLRQFPKFLLMLDVIARRGVRVDASTSLYLRWETLGECSSNCILCRSRYRSLVSDGPYRFTVTLRGKFKDLVRQEQRGQVVEYLLSFAYSDE